MAIFETDMRQTERLLQDMLARAQAAEKPVAAPRLSRRFLKAAPHRILPAWPRRKAAVTGHEEALAELFSDPAPAVRASDRPSPAPTPSASRRRKDSRREDFVIAALGVTLGLICALFPWYIFFNQEQFGVQAMKFGGKGSNSGRTVAAAGLGDSETTVQETLPLAGLDPFATGSLQHMPRRLEDAPGLDRQPFPAEIPDFRLVHVANGRAMIEDDAGMWIVQSGSMLPDSSRVRAIEQRKGAWVLLTTADQEIRLAR